MPSPLGFCMKIEMIHTRCVSEDGMRVRVLRGGERYEVAEMAACRMVAMGAARCVPDDEAINRGECDDSGENMA